jgi:hypothetical protein
MTSIHILFHFLNPYCHSLPSYIISSRHDESSMEMSCLAKQQRRLPRPRLRARLGSNLGTSSHVHMSLREAKMGRARRRSLYLAQKFLDHEAAQQFQPCAARGASSIASLCTSMVSLLDFESMYTIHRPSSYFKSPEN